jgi:hypothetical protein
MFYNRCGWGFGRVVGIIVVTVTHHFDLHATPHRPGEHSTEAVLGGGIRAPTEEIDQQGAFGIVIGIEGKLELRACEQQVGAQVLRLEGRRDDGSGSRWNRQGDRGMLGF